MSVLKFPPQLILPHTAHICLPWICTILLNKITFSYRWMDIYILCEWIGEVKWGALTWSDTCVRLSLFHQHLKSVRDTNVVRHAETGVSNTHPYVQWLPVTQQFFIGFDLIWLTNRWVVPNNWSLFECLYRCWCGDRLMVADAALG